MVSSIWYIFEVSRSHFRLLFEEVAEKEEDPKTKIDKMLDEIQFENECFQAQRKKASIVNRIALFIFFTLCSSVGVYIVFFRPELILFYRAEIQLKTYSQPEAAIQTFEHLLTKYPNYKFADTVSFRKSWILDRRLKKYKEASEGYISFLNRFGLSNVWADEVTAGLVRIFVDKLEDLESGKKHALTYLKHFPNSVMAPHMYLYLIRIFQKQNNLDKAKKIEMEALQKFGGKEIQIVNNEDKLIEFVLFNDAVNTNNYISRLQ
jgi:TolA-binding protein